MNDMNDVISSLQSAINSVNSIATELQNQISQQEMDDFISLCQRFVDMRTQCMLLQKLEENSIPDEIPQNQIKELITKNDQIIQDILKIQRSTKSINPEALQSLVNEGKLILQTLQNKVQNTESSKLDELMKLAQEELGHLNDLNKANEWYEAAYNKLSKFTGIEIIDENTLRLLGQYDIRIYNNSIQIIPGDIYIEDIDPSQSTIGVCISEIIERIAALNDFKEITQKLGWNMSIMNDAPIVELSPPLNPNNKALFALIGYETHPLIEWGNVNVEEFNNRNQSLLNKIQAYAK